MLPTSVDFVKFYFKGYKNQIYWMQGIDAEESYMRKGSKLRSFVLDAITKFAMKKAMAIFYVSEEMKNLKKVNLVIVQIKNVLLCLALM